MALPSEQDPAKTKEKSARRSTRVTLAIPIVLSGKDSSGSEFREITRTTIVNKHGAKLRTVQQLALGSEVTVENRALALAAKATVVWVGKRTSAQGTVEIGVQLFKPQNIWGIVFPPEDWKMGAPAELTGEESEETALPATPGSSSIPGGATNEIPVPSAGSATPPSTTPPPAPRKSVTGQFRAVSPVPPPGAPGPSAAGSPPQTATPGSSSSAGGGSAAIPLPSAGPGTPPSTTVPPAPRKSVTGQFRAVSPVPPPAASGPSQEQIDAMTGATLARLTKLLDETVDKHFKTYAEKIGRFTNHFGVRVQGSFQDAANRTEDRMVSALQEKLGALADRVQASRSALEALLLRFETLRKHAEALVDDTEQRISEASHQTLESALQELTANFRRAESASAAVEAEYQERLTAAAAKAADEALEKAQARFRTLAEDRLSPSSAGSGGESEQVLEGVKEQINQMVLAATTTLDTRIETLAWETADSTRAEMERLLRESAGGVVRQTTQTLKEQAQVLTQQEARKAAEAFSRNLAERTESALGPLRSAAEQQASHFRATQSESEKSLRLCLEDYQKQLAERSTAALDSFQTGLRSLAWDLQEGASRLFAQGLQNTADELAKTSTEKIRQRLQEEASAAAERFGTESSRRMAALADEILAGSLEEFRTHLAGEAGAQVDSVVRATLDTFHGQIKNLTQEAAHSFQKDAKDELQSVSKALLGGASEGLRTQVLQFAAELQEDLKASHTSFAEDARKQLIAMGQLTLETLTQDAGASLEEFRVRLQKAALESREASLRAVEAGLQEALEKKRASLSAFLDQQAEQCREQAGLQIRAFAEQVVTKATDELDRQLGRNTRTLAEMADKARVGLEAHVQKTEVEAKNSVWEYQRQIDESGSAALDKFRKETSTLVDEVVFRLQHSVRSFQSETADEVRAELQKASDNLLEVSAAQMRKQTEQTLELITVRLKEKEEEVVNDAAEAFRTRIADIFTILQTGTRKTLEPSAPERVKKQS